MLHYTIELVTLEAFMCSINNSTFVLDSIFYNKLNF